MFGLCEGSSCSLTNTRFSSAILLAWPLRQIISCNFCICKYSGRVCPIADPLLGFIFKASIEIPQEYNKIGDFQTASQGRLNRFLPRSICRQGYSRPSWLDFISVQWWCHFYKFSPKIYTQREKILLAISSRPPLGLWQRSRDKIVSGRAGPGSQSDVTMSYP